MNPEQIVLMLRCALAEDRLLERLFFSSLELAALALAVGLLMRLGQIRSPRLVCWLWLVVLIKPLVALAVGSPLTVGLFDPLQPQPAEVAQSPIVTGDPSRKPAQYGWGSGARDGAHTEMPAEAPSWPMSEPLPSVATDEPVASDQSAPTAPTRVICLGWLAGALFFLLRHLWFRARLHGIVRAATAPSGCVISRYRTIAAGVGIKRTPRLVVTDRLDSPALAGLIRPVVLLPGWLATEADDPRLAWSLRHELLHWKWLDPAAVLVRDLAGILFYFHPVAWWAGRRLTEAMELACDQALVGDASEASDYGEQLYEVLKGIRACRGLSVAGGLFATRTQVGQRIAALLDGSLVSAPRLTASSCLGALLLAAGALAVGGAVRDGKGPDGDEQTEGGRQILRFPADQSLGRIIVADAGSQFIPTGPSWRDHPALQEAPWQWGFLAEARGMVQVPPGSWLHLEMGPNFLPDLSRLSSVGANDLYSLRITFPREGSLPPDDRWMAHLAHLSGLRELSLWNTNLTHRGLQHLETMRSLKRLCIAGGATLGDAELAQVAKLQSLEELDIRYPSPELTDSGLAHLAKLKSVWRLSLNLVNSKIRGPGLAHLAAMPALEELVIATNQEYPFGDAHLEHLKAATHLKSLSVPLGAQVSDAGLASFANLNQLEALSLRSAPITDAGLLHLSRLPSLKRLDLCGTQVTDDGLASLSAMQGLEFLELPSKISDRGLAHLAKVPSLRFLIAYNCDAQRIGDAGLKHLAELPQLELLRITGTGFTDAGMDNLSKMITLTDLLIDTGAQALPGDGISDEGLAKLTTLQSLESLTLRNTRISILGTNRLSVLPHLKNLEVSPVVHDGTRLDIARLENLQRLVLGIRSAPGTQRGLCDEDLACLAGLGNLQELRILQWPDTENRITQAGFAHLPRSNSLRLVWIVSPHLNDEALALLANNKDLRWVTVQGNFTDRGLRHLESLNRLLGLRFFSPNAISPLALQRLRERLPDLGYLATGTSIGAVPKKSQPLPAGRPAPPFVVRTLDGKTVSLKDYHGKVLVLHFWATWCGPCVAAMPALKEFHAELSRTNNLEMISFSMDDTDDSALRVVREHQLAWPQVRLGLVSEVAANYAVAGAPTFFVIGPDLRVVYGGRDWGEVKAAVAKAVRR